MAIVWNVHSRYVTCFINLWALSDVQHQCSFLQPPMSPPPSISVNYGPNTSRSGTTASLWNVHSRYVTGPIDLWTLSDVQHRSSFLQPSHVPPFDLRESWTKDVEVRRDGDRMERTFEVCNRSHRFVEKAEPQPLTLRRKRTPSVMSAWNTQQTTSSDYPSPPSSYTSEALPAYQSHDPFIAGAPNLPPSQGSIGSPLQVHGFPLGVDSENPPRIEPRYRKINHLSMVTTLTMIQFTTVFIPTITPPM
jgi:hypothetical protein